MKRPQDLSQLQNLDIEEVHASSNEADKEVVDAGKVEEWERLFAEKTKVRPYITGIVMLVWMIWTIVGLIRCAAVGDITLLITSPTILIFPYAKY